MHCPPERVEPLKHGTAPVIRAFRRCVDVRRQDQIFRAAVVCRLCHAQRLIQILRAVIRARKHMRMNIDHCGISLYSDIPSGYYFILLYHITR